MNDLAAFSDTPVMMALNLIRTLLVVAMIASLITRDHSVHGSRNRYRASTVFRTTVIPVTVLLAVSTVVSLAADDWWDALPSVFLLAVMPLYFKFANDEDNDWWTGRWTKIRKAPKTDATTEADTKPVAG